MPGTAEAKTKADSRGGKYLTFGLGAEVYGVGILKVREIICYMEITPVPRAAANVRGVINLRGQVISVIDLRSCFGMGPVERSQQTCIVVVEIQCENRRLSMGIIVDRVVEVLNIPGAQIEDVPEFSADLNTNFVLGLGKVEGAVKILLDIDKVLSVQTEKRIKP
jgi:purine-binding chemotaxis protein CheW